MTDHAPLVACREVTKRYGRTTTPAVDHVSMTVDTGEIVGVVGESGSGKTTLARIICGLIDHDGGDVLINGQPRQMLNERDLWTTMQMVPQDSYGSLNPTLSARDIVAEPLRYRGGLSWRAARVEALSVLASVGVSEHMAGRPPTRLSGGQRQRVALARALSIKPQLLICDESTSALDVSIQAQILNLIQTLQSEQHFAVLFVTHDIDVVRYLSDRVLVMKQGRLVETLVRGKLEAEDVHDDYTRELLEAVPSFHTVGRR